jgi:hypothetical protein
VIAEVLEQAAPEAAMIVGRSLGRPREHPSNVDPTDLVRGAVIVDVTPGAGAWSAAMTAEQRGGVPCSCQGFEGAIS